MWFRGFYLFVYWVIFFLSIFDVIDMVLGVVEDKKLSKRVKISILKS